MKPLHIDRPVIVEGKYDRQKLSLIMVGNIITTDGFGIFNKKEKLALIRRLASERGIILLTDSDGAGGVIRSYITSSVPKGSVTQIYIPKIAGKEKRKKTASKEGTLGVEGIDAERLYALLLPFSQEGGGDASTRLSGGEITKTDLFIYGMSGADSASERRDRFAASVELPDCMTPNAFLSALNVIMGKDEFTRRANALFSEENDA